MSTQNLHQLRVAVLITGTYREAEFLLRLFPHMAGDIDYDIFLVLRHVRLESSRLGVQEPDYDVAQLASVTDKQTFICELPYIDPSVTASKYLIPVGPTDELRECGQLSMCHGVFTAISMMKGAMRPYTHVMKLRTDYMPWYAPWLEKMLEMYENVDRKIIIDGLATKPLRYPDRPDIPWQGSISDLFSFSSFEQFIEFWDFEDILPKVWTGLMETTLFRAAMVKFLGDDLQAHRRNETFMKKYFYWEPNDTKQSFYFLRAGVLTDTIKQSILKLAGNQNLEQKSMHNIIRTSYDFVLGVGKESELIKVVEEYFPNEMKKEYLETCHNAAAKVLPV